MSAIPKISSSCKKSKFQPATEGWHDCLVYMLVDLGVQAGRYGEKKELFVGLEVSDEFHEWSDQFGARREPKRLSVMVNNTLSAGSKLRPYVEALVDRPLSAGELDDPNLAALMLGRPCRVRVVHGGSGDKVYANIGELVPWPKDRPIPDARMEWLAYSVDAHDADTWERVPKFLQEKIDRRVIETPAAALPAPAGDEGTPFNDEIPF